MPPGHSSALKIIGQFSIATFTPSDSASSTIAGHTLRNSRDVVRVRAVLVSADERVHDRHAEPRRRADHLARVLVDRGAVLRVGVEVVRVVAEPRDLEPEAVDERPDLVRALVDRVDVDVRDARVPAGLAGPGGPAGDLERLEAVFLRPTGHLLERPVGEGDGEKAELHAGAARPRRNDRTSSTSTSGRSIGQVVAAVLDGDARGRRSGSAASISSPAGGGTTPSRSPATRSTGAETRAQLGPEIQLREDAAGRGVGRRVVRREHRHQRARTRRVPLPERRRGAVRRHRLGDRPHPLALDELCPVAHGLPPLLRQDDRPADGDDGGHLVRVAGRVGKHDRAAERVADERRSLELELLDERAQVADEVVERVRARGASLPPVPRRSYVTTVNSSRELARDAAPDRRARPAEAVDEHDRRARAPPVVRDPQSVLHLRRGRHRVDHRLLPLDHLDVHREVGQAAGAPAAGRACSPSPRRPSSPSPGASGPGGSRCPRAGRRRRRAGRRTCPPRPCRSRRPAASAAEPCFVAATIASIGEKPMSVTNSSMSFAYSPCGHQMKP